MISFNYEPDDKEKPFSMGVRYLLSNNSSLEDIVKSFKSFLEDINFEEEQVEKMLVEEETWCVTCGKLSLNGEFGTKENPYCPYCKKFWEEEEENKC